MIRDKTVTRFTIEANKAIKASSIFGFLNDKAKINREALVTFSGTAGRSLLVRGLMELGFDADRTIVNGAVKAQFGDTNNKLVKITHATGMHVAQAMMPKKSKLIASKSTDIMKRR